MRAITATVLVSVVLMVVARPAAFVRWDQRGKDLLSGWAGGGESSQRLVIVAIDDAALEQYGRWPWSRDRLSQLLRSIQRAGPDTIVLDMMFPEPDTARPSPALASVNERSSSTPRATNDDLLAETLQTGRVVTGFHFRFPPDQTESRTCELKPLRLTTVDTERTRGAAVFAASGVSCSVEKISRASLGVGFLNAAPDGDGTLRRTPLIVQYKAAAYPSLALAAYLASRRITDVQLWTNSAGARSLGLSGTQISVDSRTSLLLHFRLPVGAFPRISAVDLISGKAPQEALRDKIVVVGMTAVGLQDVVATPLDPLLPGVVVEATAIDNLLQNNPYRVPRGALAAELALLFVMAIASAMLLSRVGAAWSVLTMVSLLLMTWLGCAVVLKTKLIVVSPFPATMVLLGNLALLSTWRITTEKHREEQQLRTTRQFILQLLTLLTRIRDLETGAHILRVQRYAKALCETLARDANYRRVMPPKTIQPIYELIPLHDIGKVAIPDRILRYPGPLQREDYELIKTHVMQGYTVFTEAAQRSGWADEAASRIPKDIIIAHHEHWDGSGYPRGLRGEDIPLAGRIAAVSDVYDALVCKRVYKAALSHEEAVRFIYGNRGSLFDPAVVDAFMKVEQDIRAIKMSLEDVAAHAAVG